MVNLDITNTLYPFIGGLLLSVATSSNLLLKGRITGISGIFFNIITLEKSGFNWRSNLLAGLIFSAVIVFNMVGFNNKNSYIMIDTPSEYTSGLELTNWMIAGFLVGFGTKLGSGCTSGHGLCGLPRLSIRSFVSVGTFMASGILVATLRGASNGTIPSGLQVVSDINQVKLIANGFLVASGLYFLYSLAKSWSKSVDRTDVLVSFFVGGLFSVALMLSGMTRRSVVLGFLNLDKNWNPAMMFVFMGALLGNFIAFPNILRRKAPVLNDSFCVPVSKVIDWQLVLGAVIFGVGWGLAGLCPAPALIGALFYLPHVLVLFISCLAFGQIACGKFVEALDKKSK